MAPRTELALHGLASTVITAIVFGTHVRTPLGPIDDHEYPYYRSLNPTGNLFVALSDGLERSWSEFTMQARFRPVYHLGRTVSVALINQNAWIRYCVRLFVLAATLTLVGIGFSYIAKRLGLSGKAGTIMGLGISIGFAGLLPWPDVTGRLGPPDSFGWFGMLCFATFLFFLLERQKYFGALLIVAMLFLIGHRENYAVLAPFAIGILIVVGDAGSLLKKISFWFAATLAACGLAAVGATLILNNGKDYYGDEQGVRSVLSGTSLLFESSLFQTFSFGSFFLVISAPARLRVKCVWLVLILFVPLVSEFSIYQTELFVYPRYSFVAKTTTIVICCLAILFTLLRTLDALHARWSLTAGKRHSAEVILTSLLIIVVATTGAVPGLLENSRQTSRQQRAAVGFQLSIAQVSQSAQAVGRDVVVIVDRTSDSFGENDLSERSVSFQRFLKAALADTIEVHDVLDISEDALLETHGPDSQLYCVLLGVAVPAPELRTCRSSVRFF